MSIAHAASLNREPGIREFKSVSFPRRPIRKEGAFPSFPGDCDTASEEGRSMDAWTDFWKWSNNFFDAASDRRQADAWNTRWRESPEEMSGEATPGRNEKRVEEILSMLAEEGVELKGARVLDIGSGPGAFAVPFARAGAKVTAMDISTSALERLKAKADREGLLIETIESSWWSADIDRLGLRNRFDLVFATNTPAVKDPESLDRMMNCSKNFCYFGSHVRSEAYGRMDHEEIFFHVLNRAPKRPVFGKGSLFINGFIYVYLLGYRPLLRIVKHEGERVTGADEAAEREIRAIERSEPCTPAEKEKIRKYYRKTAVDGRSHTRPKGCSGMMLWSVKPPKVHFLRSVF